MGSGRSRTRQPPTAAGRRGPRLRRWAGHCARLCPSSQGRCSNAQAAAAATRVGDESSASICASGELRRRTLAAASHATAVVPRSVGLPMSGGRGTAGRVGQVSPLVLGGQGTCAAPAPRLDEACYAPSAPQGRAPSGIKGLPSTRGRPFGERIVATTRGSSDIVRLW